MRGLDYRVSDWVQWNLQPNQNVEVWLKQQSTNTSEKQTWWRTTNPSCLHISSASHILLQTILHDFTKINEKTGRDSKNKLIINLFVYFEWVKIKATVYKYVFYTYLYNKCIVFWCWYFIYLFPTSHERFSMVGVNLKCKYSAPDNR